MTTHETVQAAEAPAAVTMRSRLLRISAVRDYGIVVSFVALFATLSLVSDVFFSTTNLLNILDQNAAVGIIAVGGTLVFIAGGFDLSVGAIYAVAGVVAAQTAPHLGPGGGILTGALIGLGFGVVNGILTTLGRINPFIATLATSIMIRGIALVLTGGFLVTVADPSFTLLGRAELGEIKYTVFCWLGFSLICGFLLWRTKFGRYMYAAGGNAEAARLSGIRVGLVRATTFAISGLAAGLGGVIVASRVATGQADSGIGIELSAIAGVVIGGTSIMGGEGAIWRTILGVLLLALIGNGFNLLNVNPTYQQIFQGGIIITAVAVDAWARRTSG